MMKKIILLIAFALYFLGNANAQEYVQPYLKKNGKYVEGHYKTSKNSTKIDNYSTKGNTNPYTNKKGTKDPYKSYPRRNKKTY